MINTKLIQHIVDRYNIPIQSIVIGEGLAQLDGLQLGTKLAMVVDHNTDRALGIELYRALGDNYTIHKILLENPVAHINMADELCNMLIATDAIIAVGSGTINDLCKYAAFKLNKPYVVFATALSMNGYASTTSSITIGNLKQSLPTTLPRAIFINLTVVRNAPLRLTASGVGDLLCRSTAEADWHLSHLLTGSTYHPTVYQWLKPYEEKLYSSTSILQEIEHLSQMQILSGLGMCASQGSYPASQGEHIIAHIMDSLHPNDTLHGEQIAVTTITMAKLQEAMLQSKPVLPPSPIGQIINSNWDEICHKIRQNMIAAERLEAIARTCGLATHYHQLQWNKDDYALAIRQGAYKRNRFGFLDLAILSGRLDSLIESII